MYQQPYYPNGNYQPTGNYQSNQWEEQPQPYNYNQGVNQWNNPGQFQQPQQPNWRGQGYRFSNRQSPFSPSGFPQQTDQWGNPISSQAFQGPPMTDQFMGVPPADLSFIPPVQKITPQPCEVNLEIVKACKPYIIENLQKCRVARQVMNMIGALLNPQLPTADQFLMSSLCWFVLAEYETAVQEGSIPEKSPITPNVLKGGVAEWFVQLMPDVIRQCEQACRQMNFNNMQQMNRGFNPNINPGNQGWNQSVDMFKQQAASRQSPMGGYGAPRNQWEEDAMRDNTYQAPQGQFQPPSQFNQPPPQVKPIVTPPPAKEPPRALSPQQLESLNRCLDFMEKWNKERGIPFSKYNIPEEERVNVVREFKKKMDEMKAQGLYMMTIEEKKLYSKELNRTAVKGSVIKLSVFNRIKEEHENRRKEERKLDMVKFEPQGEREERTFYAKETWMSRIENMFVTCGTVDLKRPVTDDHHVIEDVDPILQSSSEDKFFETISYKKLVTRLIPTSEMMEVRDNLRKLVDEERAKPHHEKIGAGMLLANVIMPDMQVDYREELNSLIVEEFNRLCAVKFRLEEHPDTILEIEDIEDLNEENFQASSEEDGMLEIFAQYNIGRPELIRLLNLVVTNLILREGSFVTPEDPDKKHILLTNTSDNFTVSFVDEDGNVIGEKAKEDLFLEGTDEQRKEWVESFMETFTTFRINKITLLTNYIDADDEVTCLTDLDEMSDSPNKVAFLSALMTVNKARSERRQRVELDNIILVEDKNMDLIQSYNPTIFYSLDEDGKSVIENCKLMQS